jgi:hypothetical protein
VKRIMVDDDLSGRLATCEREIARLREVNGRLSQHILDLEARIADLQRQLFDAQQARVIRFEVLGSAMLLAVTAADTILGEQLGTTAYTIAALDCDIKGFLETTGSSVAMRPSDPFIAGAADSMSVVRFSIAKMPADLVGLS